MLTRQDILKKLEASKANLSGTYKVKAIALFGSWARGDNQPGSDVDILVEVDPSIGLDFVTLGDRLEDILGVKVDLVSRGAIKPRLWMEIEPDLIYV